MKIGVFGASIDTEEDITNKARKIGEEIAKAGNTIITGACKGIPLAAVEGAKAMGGYSIGFSGAYSREQHRAMMGTALELYDSLVLIPEEYKYKELRKYCLKYRNVSSVAECDAAIIIGGRWGTLNEFSIAYDMEKIIGILSYTGGATECIKLLIDFFQKKTDSQVIFDSNPVSLVNQVCQISKDSAIAIRNEL
ncbi:hypothetical protein [Okeania sp. SIO2C9]|uniref:SLOG cluster 4 domain-containing protein n=1 Tax=Okeania sp. SIO2C9 TaxID=2607791 RepID=UPI002600A9B4|nr:hypothetical protein [Okeania sp. SIO2C9]